MVVNTQYSQCLCYSIDSRKLNVPECTWKTKNGQGRQAKSLRITTKLYMLLIKGYWHWTASVRGPLPLSSGVWQRTKKEWWPVGNFPCKGSVLIVSFRVVNCTNQKYCNTSRKTIAISFAILSMKRIAIRSAMLSLSANVTLNSTIIIRSMKMIGAILQH